MCCANYQQVQCTAVTEKSYFSVQSIFESSVYKGHDGFISAMRVPYCYLVLFTERQPFRTNVE